MSQHFYPQSLSVLIHCRLILYFPVSALVTLFGNILQNPLDPRAKSDTKLMNLVVTFLSTLGQEAETGGVHRMLGVCSEFERIAKIVIDKAERDTNRRKRKSHEPQRPSISQASPSQMSNTPQPSSAATPTGNYSGTSQLSPKFNGEQNRANNVANGGFSPMDTASTNNGSAPRDGPGAWPSPSPQQQQEWNPNAMDFGNFSEMTGFGQPIASPPLPGPAAPGVAGGYQPLLPQELWQMPGGLDWDWAEFTGGAYPSFENGSAAQNGR